MTEAVYTDDPVKGKVCVGELDTDTGLFIKKVMRAKHYFRLIKGYALQKSTFDDLKRRGAKLIRFIEGDTGRILDSTPEIWEDHGGLWNGLNGKQKTLSERYFKISA